MRLAQDKLCVCFIRECRSNVSDAYQEAYKAIGGLGNYLGIAN